MCIVDSDVTDDGVDEVSQLLKLNVDRLYYNIDDVSKLVIPGHNHTYTTIYLIIHSLQNKYDQLRQLITNLEVLLFILLCYARPF